VTGKLHFRISRKSDDSLAQGQQKELKNKKDLEHKVRVCVKAPLTVWVELIRKKNHITRIE